MLFRSANPVALVAQADDWSGRPQIPPSAELLAKVTRRSRDPNGGIRREPELPQHEDVVIGAPLAENEFDAAPDDGDTDAVQARALSRSMQGIARSVTIDPEDPMDL